jgi:hypothetical protein
MSRWTAIASASGSGRRDPVIQDIESIAAKRTIQIETAPEWSARPVLLVYDDYGFQKQEWGGYL